MFLVTKQDVCRYYKEDFWGELIKEKQVRKHLNRTIFGKPFKSRRAQKNYRSSRFEVIKLDNRRFQKKRRIPKSVIRHHNVEKVRLYYSNMDEYGLRAFIMLQRGHVSPTGNKFREGMTIHDRLGYRLDHLIFLLNWAPTLSEARKKIINGYFQINKFIPKRYDIVPVLGDELKVRDNFKKATFRYLYRLRNRRSNNVKNVNKVRISFIRLKKKRRKAHTLLRKINKTRKRYLIKLKKYRSFILKTKHRRSRRRALNLKKWSHIRVPYSFFPRSFLSTKHSLVQNRIVKLRKLNSYSNLGRIGIFNLGFSKPQMDWYSKFGKFFFNQFLKNYNGRFFLYRNNSYYREESNLQLKTLVNPLSNEEFLLRFQLRTAAMGTDNKILLSTPVIDIDMKNYALENGSNLLLFLEKKQDYFSGANSNDNDRFLVKFPFISYYNDKDKNREVYRTLVDHFTFLKKRSDLEIFERETTLLFSPVFTIFNTLRNLTSVVERRAVFNLLWQKMYLGRLKRSNIVRDTVARLAKSRYSVFKLLTKKFRYKMALAKFAAITKSFSKAVLAHGRLPKKSGGGFYPTMERSEYAIPSSLARIKTDFMPSVTVAQDNTFALINNWMDSFFTDIATNTLFSHSVLMHNNMDKINADSDALLNSNTGNLALSSLLNEKFGKYFIQQLVEPTTPFLIDKALKVKSVENRLASVFLKKNTMKSDIAINVVEDKVIEQAGALDIGLNVIAYNFTQALDRLSHNFDFYPKLITFRKKIRRLNKIFKPKFKRIRRRRRRTLLLRSFNNLLVSYRLLKVIFIGYRRIRRKATPFFYFPCKFSLKPFLNYYGCKSKMKTINKKEGTYVQKPHAPFNLPKLNKKKFGMLQQAMEQELKIRFRRSYKYLALKYA